MLKAVLCSAVVAILIEGCAMYKVTHEEILEDGTYSTTRLFKMTPPGSRDSAEAVASIGVDPSGAWKMDLGQQSDTDLTGTAAIIDALIGRLTGLAYQAGTMSAPRTLLQEPIQIPPPPIETSFGALFPSR